jgi:hypothetical protein
MLVIPEGVSPHLKDELEQYQKQIHILLRNHQVRQMLLKLDLVSSPTLLCAITDKHRLPP